MKRVGEVVGEYWYERKVAWKDGLPPIGSIIYVLEPDDNDQIVIDETCHERGCSFYDDRICKGYWYAKIDHEK